MFCTSCGGRLSSGARFCGACGSRVEQNGDPNSAETILGDDRAFESAETIPPSPPGSASRRSIPSPRVPSTPRPGSRSGAPASSGSVLTSSDAIGGARFAPDVIVGERYRIVALLGRGGMGEVYRAEDLTLQQVVAIKFLPESLSRDAAALARFHSEVRIARQVSHANVCRVFDIGDAAGIPFLTMEYVDGEDLASLIRRIGRLSPDKATEIARQICAGLAAAHERGVIHRDLKPANVMLDGAGKVRITDFGLAAVAAAIQSAEVRAGTPAYMAPEQLAGREVTARSDLYSLGLVLYEVLTGKRAFEAATLPELIKLREQGALTSPSTLVRDLDPALERVILRCIEKDPAQRPLSALQVAAALPGGDPLAAALAAGETPSPEMVAAAGSTEGIRPRHGLALLATVLVGLVLYAFEAQRNRLQNVTPMEKTPDVLVARAQETIRQLGFTETHADSAYGFQADQQYLNFIQSHDITPSRWKRLSADRPASMVFWYRQSPREMQALDFFGTDGSGSASLLNPPLDVTGMISIVLDTQGRLVSFWRVPPQDESAVSTSLPSAPDWSGLFAAAGMHAAAYNSATPEWTPLLYADTRAAWTRPLADPPNAVERIEAASYRGQPVYFEVRYPWSSAVRDQGSGRSAQQKYVALILVSLFSVIIVASMVIVRRNRRLNRGDAAGSERLGNFIALTVLLMWLFSAHHVASIGEWNVALLGLAWAFLVSSLARVLYFALEPYVRRHDPHTLIAWSRLLAGKFRDPLVGRDILIGAAYGVVLSLFESCDSYLLPFLGKLPPMPDPPLSAALVGVLPALGAVFHYAWVFTLYSLLIFFLFFLLKLVVKKDWIAAVVIVFLGAITNTGGDYFWWTFIASAAIWLSIYLVLRRFGLVAVITGLVIQNILTVFPITSHLERWYATGAMVGMGVIAAIAVFAFKNALAGQPIFADSALER
jgi:Protein kinase domain